MATTTICILVIIIISTHLLGAHPMSAHSRVRHVLLQEFIRAILKRSGASGFGALAPELHLESVVPDEIIPIAPVEPEVRLARMARTSARGFGRRRR